MENFNFLSIANVPLKNWSCILRLEDFFIVHVSEQHSPYWNHLDASPIFRDLTVRITASVGQVFMSLMTVKSGSSFYAE